MKLSDLHHVWARLSRDKLSHLKSSEEEDKVEKKEQDGSADQLKKSEKEDQEQDEDKKRRRKARSSVSHTLLEREECLLDLLRGKREKRVDQTSDHFSNSLRLLLLRLEGLA